MDRKFEVYKLVFAHNDREVEMLWLRNGAFLVADSAFVFVVGILRDSTAFVFFLSLLGLPLAIFGLYSNLSDYAWSIYWIRELRRLEENIEESKLWTRAASAAAIEQGRPPLRFGKHGIYVALVFVICWVTLPVFFLLRLAIPARSLYSVDSHPSAIVG